MDIPENRKRLAHLLATGQGRAEIGAAFDVHVDTISKWTQRPDVQALVTQENQQRINRIVAKVDAELEARLKEVKKLEVEDIIKIRREMLPQRVEMNLRPDEAKATQELLAWFYGEDGIPGMESENDAEPAGDV